MLLNKAGTIKIAAQLTEYMSAEYLLICAKIFKKTKKKFRIEMKLRRNTHQNLNNTQNPKKYIKTDAHLCIWHQIDWRAS